MNISASGATIKPPGCIPPPESPPAPQSPAQILPAPECAWAYSTAAGCAECPGPTRSGRPIQSRAKSARSGPASLHAHAAPGAESAGRCLPSPPRQRSRAARLKRLAAPPSDPSQSRAMCCAGKAPRRNPPRQSCALTGPASRGIGSRRQTHRPPCSAYERAPARHGCRPAALRLDPPSSQAGASRRRSRLESRAVLAKLSAHQRNVALAAIHLALVGDHAKLAVARLDAALAGAHNIALVAQPVADQLRHGQNRQPVFLAKRNQVRNRAPSPRRLS